MIHFLGQAVFLIYKFRSTLQQSLCYHRGHYAVYGYRRRGRGAVAKMMYQLAKKLSYFVLVLRREDAGNVKAAIKRADAEIKVEVNEIFFQASLTSFEKVQED